MTDPVQLMAMLKVALDRHDRDGVNRACNALIAVRAPLRAQWRMIAAVLIENGEMRAARSAIDLLVQATGNSPLGRFAQAQTYAQSGAVAKAYEILTALPADVPDTLNNAYTLGTTATNLGRFDVAGEHLRRAVRLAPWSGQSWLALAMLGRVDAADGRAMLAARSTVSVAPASERGAFGYALGKLLHEQGDVDAAFASFAAGAAVERGARPADAATERRAFAAAVDGWTGVVIDTLARRDDGDARRPIFVTGLPRSGTTLVEQILASHTTVDGGEELGVFRHLIGDIGGSDVESVRRAAAANRLDALADLYRHLVDERFAGTGRVVDKSLLASRHMGLLSVLFPEAPVVWLRRDPLDNAWSIFRTYFRAELGWSFDLRTIAEEMRREDALREHWLRERPDRVMAVDYAELVSDPAAVIPRIVAHCGLPLEAQQMRPHESKRVVTTASVAQVRAPINRDAIGVAEPYRRHLKPFVDAYTAAGGTID